MWVMTLQVTSNFQFKRQAATSRHSHPKPGKAEPLVNDNYTVGKIIMTIIIMIIKKHPGCCCRETAPGGVRARAGFIHQKHTSPGPPSPAPEPLAALLGSSTRSTHSPRPDSQEAAPGARSSPPHSPCSMASA